MPCKSRRAYLNCINDLFFCVQVNEALRLIFDKLKNRPLDKGLGSQHESLYDFVDSDSVQRLLTQTTLEIKEMQVSLSYSRFDYRIFFFG